MICIEVTQDGSLSNYICTQAGRVHTLFSQSKRSTQTSNRPHLLWVWLTILVAASFAVRLAAWAFWGTGTIESEGAEYAKIAENLRNGIGFVGLVFPGPCVNFSPLFPLLIAGTSFVTHDYELAGRLVALIIGALLPLPVFGIAAHLFNRRVGFIAAILTLLHPLLVHLSFMVYSEGPYATLFLSAIYIVVRALEDSSVKLWSSVGAAFGLCYLLRAEASAAFGIAVLFCLTATEGSLTLRCKRAASAALVFLVVALPEVIFLYRSTGKVLLEAKSTILTFYTGRRILAAEKHPGQDYKSADGLHEVPSPEPNAEGGYPAQWEGKWAFYGIDTHLNGTGSAMRPFVQVVRETHVTLKDMIPLLKKGVRRNVPGLFRNLSSGWLGAPLLPALALLGAFRRPWKGRQASTRLFVMVVAAAPVAASLLVLWGDARYYFVFVPLLCVWAANGVHELGMWARASSTAAGWRVLALPAVSQGVVPGFLALAVIISPLEEAATQYEFSDSAPPFRVEREVGLWIGHQQNPAARIMDLSLPLTYHAGAQLHLYFPYCTGELALRYLDTAQPDYIVLRRGGKFTKYYEEWTTRGIPDHRAELLQLPPLAGADKFVIYRWHHDH
jgi:4-amino-4-deoxy-L-arabinose transferase-like glycosyltransferase